MTSVWIGLVTRSPQRLAADPSRVISRLFVPGQEGFERQDSRAGAVMARILALDEDEVRRVAWMTWSPNSRSVTATWPALSAGTPVKSPIGLIPPPSSPRRGCCCWVRRSPASTRSKVRRLCNPSMVAHPDQSGIAGGQSAIRDECARHRRGTPVVHRLPDRRRRRVRRRHDRRSRPVRHHRDSRAALLDAAVFRSELTRLRRGRRGRRLRPRRARRPVHPKRSRRTARPGSESPAHPQPCGRDDFTDPSHRRTNLRRRVRRRYTALRARPVAGDGAEDAGMEDARFVRFVDDDGSVKFYATLHGLQRVPYQPTTAGDARTSARSPPCRSWAPAAANKGLALFPRRIRGRFAAMCAIGPGIEYGGILRSSVRVDQRRCPASSRREPGRRCNSAIVARPSKPTRDGWCSPTASARCAPTASERFCSISTTRHGSSVSYAQPLLSPAPTSRTATSPTSCTRAAHWSTRTPGAAVRHQ